MVGSTWRVDARKRIDRTGDPQRSVGAEPCSTWREASFRTDGRCRVEVVVRQAVWRGVGHNRKARNHRSPRGHIKRAVVIGVEVLAIKASEVAHDEDRDIVIAFKVQTDREVRCRKRQRWFADHEETALGDVVTREAHNHFNRAALCSWQREVVVTDDDQRHACKRFARKTGKFDVLIEIGSRLLEADFV